MGLFEKLGFEFDADLRPLSAKMKQATTLVGSSAKTMGSRFTDVNSRLSTMATKVGLVASLIGGAAVTSTASFEQNMARARTMTDLTNQEWERLTENVQAAAGSFGIGDFALVGDAVFQAFSTGSDGVADATADVTDAFRNYVAQGTDVGVTLGFIAQQQTIFGEAAGTNSEILDRLANATIKAQSNQQSMAKAMAETGQLAKAAGLSADDLAGALATLTQTTGSAETAATSFKGLLNAILTPTAAQEDIIRQLNDAIRAQVGDLQAAEATWGSVDAALASIGKRTLEFGQASVEAAGGFFPFVEGLSDALATSDINTRRIAESMEGYAAVLAFTSDNGARLGENIGFITSETGRLDKQLGFMQDTASNAFARAVAELKIFTVELLSGTGVLGDLKVVLGLAAEGLRELTSDLADWIEANPEALEQIKQQAVEWGKIAAAVFLGSKAFGVLADVGGVLAGVLGLFPPLIKGVSTLFTGLLIPAVKFVGVALVGLVGGPIAALIGAFAAIGTALFVFVDDWGAVWDTVVDIVETAGEMVAELWSGLVDGLRSIGGAIYDAVTWPFVTAAEFVQDLWGDVLAFFTNAFNGITNFFGVQGFSGGGFVGGFNKGGFVPGVSGGGSDSVLAALTPGEYVINAPSAQVLGPEFLAAANAAGQTGQAPGGSGGDTHLHVGGILDLAMVREVLEPMLARVRERRLGPLERSAL